MKHERVTAAEFRAIKPRKRGRFGVVKPDQRTVDGITFASRKEMNRYLQLKLLERAGEIVELECQPEFVVSIAGERFCRYRADFRYRRALSGEYVIEDVKGDGKGGTRGDAAYKLRKTAAELFYRMTVTEV